jgi:hypothetical protein
MVRLKTRPCASAAFGRLTDGRGWAARTEAEMNAGRFFGAAKVKTLDELFARYLPQVRARLKTRAEIERHLAWWSRKAGGETLDAVTPARLAAWRDYSRALDRSTVPGTQTKSLDSTEQ